MRRIRRAASARGTCKTLTQIELCSRRASSGPCGPSGRGWQKDIAIKRERIEPADSAADFGKCNCNLLKFVGAAATSHETATEGAGVAGLAGVTRKMPSKLGKKVLVTFFVTPSPLVAKYSNGGQQSDAFIVLVFCYVQSTQPTTPPLRLLPALVVRVHLHCVFS